MEKTAIFATLAMLLLVVGCNKQPLLNNEPVGQSSIPVQQQDEELLEEKSSWHGKIYKITTIDKQEGMEDYDVGSVIAWPSYDDRSNVLFELTNNESVSLIGYDSEHDYCQVKKNKQDGWIACGWVQNLPNTMTDYWEK